MECPSTKPPAWKKKLPGGQRLVGVRALFLIFLMLGAVSSAWGADPVPDPGAGAQMLVLKPVLDLPQKNKGPVIIHGQLANPNEYSVSFLFESDHEKCTGFLVGARTLMTAAHCVSDGTSIRIEKKDGSTTYEGKCERAPGYQNDPSQDWALCLLATDYPPPIISGIPLTGYEVLNTAPSTLTILKNKRKQIQITGFGCTYPGGPLDNKYRVGWAYIDGLPPGVYIQGIGTKPNVLRIAKQQSTTQQSALCGGDSGGPAFEISDKSRYYRRVIGINSRNYDLKGWGYLASTSTKAALAFFNNWADDHQQKICGLHKDAVNCRYTEF
jgi:V8-like Glu-specific endopeptidase